MDITEIDAALADAYRLAHEIAQAIKELGASRHGSPEQDAFNHAGGAAGALKRARRAWQQALREVKGE
jgi:hypothetical protein